MTGVPELRQERLVEQVVERLKLVIDPELGVDIYNLGLVYDIEVTENADVTVFYTLTSMACPVAPLIEAQIREVVGDLAGVEDVITELRLHPPWTRERMSTEARVALGM
jgi:metal-sulfur cluster biosynthetic enzyme